ncbi:MAG TPA: hypothetical protein VGC45_15650 [Gryllotalpicola sp.]
MARQQPLTADVSTTLANITASDWLDMRDRVAEIIGRSNARMENATRVKIAEALLRAGFIDIPKVLADIHPITDPILPDDALKMHLVEEPEQ